MTTETLQSKAKEPPKRYISFEEAARIFKEEHRIVIPTAVLERVSRRMAGVNGCVYEDSRRKKKKNHQL
jgi:transposase InsO family protein